MAKTLQHLRGNEAEWSLHDIVVADGEIAILKTENGKPKIKVGNGVLTFSELNFVDGDIMICSATPVLLGNGVEFRMPERAALEMTLPTRCDNDFYSVLSFDSGSTPTQFTYPENTVFFSGNDVISGIFIPSANTHYTLFVWYDGRYEATVRGVSIE